MAAIPDPALTHFSMTDQPELPKILSLYLQITQYPILARRIRDRMREELVRRGVITPLRLEEEAKEKAVLSQHREGLIDPFGEEDSASWEQRMQQIRDHLIDFYFAYNLPLELFHRIVEDLLAARRGRSTEPLTSFDEITLTFNPELAPTDLLIRKIEQYEALPAPERERVAHHIEEMRVVLIKSLISDQLSFIGRAKKWLDVDDFRYILQRRIGNGKVGGKAAGMLLAWKILQTRSIEADGVDLQGRVAMPRSYFIAADVFYEYLALNKVEYINQKYKPIDQIRADYPMILAEYEQGRFPEEIADQLREILREVGDRPVIVRSSSLLEDNFGTSFAGKYDSYFCPNQGNDKENLRDLTRAIRRIYASVYSPDALIYRRRMNLIDYDERMAILLQEVQGERYRQYFFPTLAGVAFSQAPVLWNSRLKREDGFLRLVTGLGTRAVNRVGEDYPRLVYLSHPTLRPETTPEAMTHYAQHLIDAIDLERNQIATLTAGELFGDDYAPLRYLASVREEDGLNPIRSLGPRVARDRLVLTFDALLARTDFAAGMRSILQRLEKHYGFPVDVEFTASLRAGPGGKLTPIFHVLQCRPQSLVRGGEVPAIPDVSAEDRLFTSGRMVPRGRIDGVAWVVYVKPEFYRTLQPRARADVARLIGRLNKKLEGQDFVLIGPGRWGSSNIELGVPVSYADIFNARALVEVAGGPSDGLPDPSYGTHFFQDLVESNIFALAVAPGQNSDSLHLDFLETAPDALGEELPADAAAAATLGLKLVKVAQARPGQSVQILMDGDKALAHFV